MRDLYVNYDCDVACTNLFETLGRCARVCSYAVFVALSDTSHTVCLPPRSLCHNAIPDGGTALTSLHVLALEGMLAILSGLAAAGAGGPLTTDVGDALPFSALGNTAAELAAPLSAGGQQSDLRALGLAGQSGIPMPELQRLSLMRAAEVLRQRKQLKRRLALASQRFNTDSKHWIEYAQVRRREVEARVCVRVSLYVSRASCCAGARSPPYPRGRTLRRSLPAGLSGPRPHAHRAVHLRA